MLQAMALLGHRRSSAPLPWIGYTSEPCTRLNRAHV